VLGDAWMSESAKADLTSSQVCFAPQKADMRELALIWPFSHNQTSRRLRLTLRQFAFTPVALTKAAFMLSSFLSGSTPIVVSFSCTLGVCMAFNVPR
jgi:hypothetical protein